MQYCFREGDKIYIEGKTFLISKKKDKFILALFKEKKINFDLKEQIKNLIKEAEAEGGIFLEDINSKLGFQDTEEIIKRLLEDGDIYEVRPMKFRWLG